MQAHRQAERVRTSLYAVWDLHRETVRSGTVTDLSPTGCFIQSATGLSPAERVEILLRLPTERWLSLPSTVARLQEEIGFGVRFGELACEDREMLRLLAEYYGD